MATIQNSILISGNNDHTYEIYDLGSGQTFNVSSYEGYQNFTTSNFLITPSGSLSTGWRSNANGPGAIWGGGSASISCSYNNSNGVATIKLNNNSNGKAEAGGSDSESKSTNVHAWLIIKK